MNDSGDGTNSSGGFVFSTNGLWLEITGITNGTVSLILHNATNGVYEIWSTTSLTNPVWEIEDEVWPVTYQTWTPFTVPVLDRTNSLFFYARDWTGVTANGNQTPEWWFFEYFGSVNLADTNLDVNGNTLLFDYTNGIDPNVTSLLVLTPNVTNGYAPLTVSFTVNASALPGTFQSIAWDWEGDGIPDLIASNLYGQSYTYSAGTYSPVVTVTTSQGTFSSGGGVNGINANMLATNSVTIVADNVPQIVWSQNVRLPAAIRANADGSAYVLSQDPIVLLLYSSNGTVLRSLQLAPSNDISLAFGFDVDTNGNVYIPMWSDNQVIKLNPDSGSSYTLDTNFNNIGYIGNADMSASNGNYQLNGPFDVAVSADGTAIYVADEWNGRIQKFTTSGVFVLSIGGFGEPTGVSADETGTLFVTDPGNWGVFSLVNDSIFDYFADDGATKVSADSMVLYDANFYSGVQQFDSSSYSFIRAAPASIGLNFPFYVSIWPSKIEQRVYIADYYNNRVIGVAFPRADPLAVWNAMKQAVATNNLPLALSYFSQWTSAKYGAEFQAVGLPDVSTILSGLPTPTLTEMTDNFAHYIITVSFDGVPITFFINFSNENGIWKISSF